MDRPIVYPGQIPLETDLLNTNRFAMIGLAKLAAAILGTATQVSGFAATPDSPASMIVKIGAGEIYALTNLDGTAYSSLAADTTHQILKQGIMLDPVLLPLTAPATVGQSVNYLIQATLQETDTGAVVLPYYNSANPAGAYSGPSNSGAAQATTRKCGVVVSAKAGVAAATGSQVTPAADSGCVGMWVVTVAYGQTTITAPNIAAYFNAPTIPTLSTLVALSAFTGSNQNLVSDNLIQKLPGGLIIQVGYSLIPTGNGDIVSFPVAFPNEVLGLFSIDRGAGCNVTAISKNGTSKSTLLAYGKIPSTGSYSSTGFGFLAIGR
jgi:hypothetical protein